MSKSPGSPRHRRGTRRRAARDSWPLRAMRAWCDCSARGPGPNARTFPEVLTLTRATGVAGDFEHVAPMAGLCPTAAPTRATRCRSCHGRCLISSGATVTGSTHPGDNIAVDMNLTDANLPVGTLLQAGTAILRVSDEPNDGCVKWKVRCGRAAYDWVSRPEHLSLRLRGLFCSVEQDGVLRLGDSLRRL